MSTKTKSKAKAAPKKETPKAKESPSSKESKKGAVLAAPAEGAPAVDLDELEEQEDAAAASSGGGGGGNAAAIAAAGGATEMSASFKNFRHHPDMENFYRFIYDNDLRHEALAIIDEMMLDKQKRRAMKTAKTHAH